MKFVVSTKPLKNVTSLGIIKANLSKYYYRSHVVQITATRDTLKINIEAASIKTRMTLQGSGDSDTPVSVIIDCLMFKSLIDSIETDVMSIEFVQGGISIHAGTSKFSIPQLMDANDVQLNEPTDIYSATSTITIKPENWQFVKDHQMYALSVSEDHPVYTNVWVGADKEIIAGDYDMGRFTYSKYGDFDTTCLIPPSLVNLFTSIPEGSTITKVDRSYLLNVATDSYSMVTEFTPKYEDDDSVGSYNSNIILGTFKHPDNYITVDVGSITKFINQTAIVKQSDLDKYLDFSVSDGILTLTNRTSHYSMDVSSIQSYSVKFVMEYIKQVLVNLDSDTVNIAPMIRSGVDANGQTIERAIGCIFWTDNLTTVLAGQGQG